VQVLIAGLGELGRTVALRLLRNGYRVSGWRRGDVGADKGDRTSSEPGTQASGSGLEIGAKDNDLVELATFGQRWHYGSGTNAWPALAAQADVVINLMPLTAATQGFFDAARMAGFKRGAGFVNLARGAAVVDADLIAALDAGQLSHAVLDVFRREPLAADHPFWRHPSVTVLPHVAALTDPRSASRIAAANIELVRAASGAALPGGVTGLVDRGRGY
jgi:glyoxylate/hydroxypyruvate reductase A